MNFIKYKDQEIVNLENVTSVTKREKTLCIYFEFNAMNSEETNGVKWIMRSLEDFNKAISYLCATDI